MNEYPIIAEDVYGELVLEDRTPGAGQSFEPMPSSVRLAYRKVDGPHEIEFVLRDGEVEIITRGKHAENGTFTTPWEVRATMPTDLFFRMFSELANKSALITSRAMREAKP